MTISATTQGLRMGVATSTSRPTVPFDGQVISETDTDSLKVYNGTSWVGVSRIAQVVTASTSTVQTASSTTYVDATSLTLSITPQSATNKILITFNTMGSKTADNANNNLGVRILRDATVIATWDSGLYTGTAMLLIVPVCYNFLDSPSTTSATTYKIQFRNANNNGASVSIQNSNHPAMLMAQEITA